MHLPQSDCCNVWKNERETCAYNSLMGRLILILREVDHLNFVCGAQSKSLKLHWEFWNPGEAPASALVSLAMIFETSSILVSFPLNFVSFPLISIDSLHFCMNKYKNENKSQFQHFVFVFPLWTNSFISKSKSEECQEYECVGFIFRLNHKSRLNCKGVSQKILLFMLENCQYYMVCSRSVPSTVSLQSCEVSGI